MRLNAGFAYHEVSQNRKGSKQLKRCRYNNSGFCKRGVECDFAHSKDLWASFLTTGKCQEIDKCSSRHPKNCKFWLGDNKECLRGQMCKYLHRIENNSKNVNILHSNQEENPDASQTVNNKRKDTNTEKKTRKKTSFEPVEKR